jgi:hypothetical protein
MWGETMAVPTKSFFVGDGRILLIVFHVIDQIGMTAFAVFLDYFLPSFMHADYLRLLAKRKDGGVA